MTKPWKRLVAEQHIRSLCRSYHIAIRYVKGPRWMHLAESSETARMVHIPHPNNARQYLVGLHEIGHLLGPIGVSSRNDHPAWGATMHHMLAEASAWGWAMEHIHTELDESIAFSDFNKTFGRGMVSHGWSMADHAVHG